MMTLQENKLQIFNMKTDISLSRPTERESSNAGTSFVRMSKAVPRID